MSLRIIHVSQRYSRAFSPTSILLTCPNCPAKRFREFINLPAYLDIKPNDDTIDILGFLAFEMVRALCVGGLAVKRALEESYQAVEITGAKRKAPSSDQGVESPAKRRRSLSPESGGAWGSVPGSSLFLPPPEARRALRPTHIQEAFAKMQRDWAHQRGSGMRNWRGGLVRTRVALI
ncbi:Transcription initiation protein spt3 [Ceratobasidium sp. UAMH 11750]|nr:Transcription initiation protein spt3 [Ceratobasidium sp. UAMH 11750]